MNLVQFFNNLQELNPAAKSALKDFAANPNQSNQGYFIRYLAALFSNKLISSDAYHYFLALARVIELDMLIANRIYQELRGHVTLAEAITKTGKQAIRTLLEKCKAALESCDVNDTQFPLDTQYYDQDLVNEALTDINKMLESIHE